MKDVDIQGGLGDDVFDLHSGTGLVDGGDDEDLLILSQDSDDYNFEKTGASTGTITDAGGGVTDLDVANIEEFKFDNGTFSFDDLFMS